jgi:hypothetical protein
MTPFFRNERRFALRFISPSRCFIVFSFDILKHELQILDFTPSLPSLRLDQAEITTLDRYGGKTIR